MTEKITKIRFYIDYEKEEKWVNEMSQHGWQLVKFGIGYFKFEKGVPGEYIYRNEMLTGLGTKNNSKEYISFLKETGVELVTKCFAWAYFRKRTEEGVFELYSDSSSKVQYLNRIFYLFLFLAILNLFFGVSNVLNLYGGESFTFNKVVGIMNLLATLLISFPLFLVYKRRKALKSNLDIFHD